MNETTTQHTCHGAVFCGTPRALAVAECPACNASGACPATGRSASVCADQTHAACWASLPATDEAERQLEAAFRRIDPTY